MVATVSEVVTVVVVVDAVVLSVLLQVSWGWQKVPAVCMAGMDMQKGAVGSCNRMKECQCCCGYSPMIVTYVVQAGEHTARAHPHDQHTHLVNILIIQLHALALLGHLLNLQDLLHTTARHSTACHSTHR